MVSHVGFFPGTKPRSRTYRVSTSYSNSINCGTARASIESDAVFSSMSTGAGHLQVQERVLMLTAVKKYGPSEPRPLTEIQEKGEQSACSRRFQAFKITLHMMVIDIIRNNLE